MLPMIMSLCGCGQLFLLPFEASRQLLGIDVKKIGIYDLGSGKWTSFRTDVWHNEKIVHIDEKERTFQTLRCETPITEVECRKMKMKKVDFSGAVISEAELPPLFGIGPLRTFAVSLDGASVAYYKPSTKGIHIYDFPTSRDSLLLENVSSSGFSIKGIQWVSETDLVLMISGEKTGGRENAIFRINVARKEVTTLCKPIQLSDFKSAFSRNYNHLAYLDGYLHGGITVIDTETGRIAATIPGNRELMSNPCWSPDGSRMGYVKGRNVRVFSLDSGEDRVAKNLDDDYVCHSLSFLDENSLLYYGAKPKRSLPSMELHIVDIATGKDKIIGTGDWHSAYVVANGEKIIVEMGY